MKQSLFYIPTLREIPKDAEIKSHQVLLKGGYIKQTAAGVYVYLPLANRILQKVEKIIREEHDCIGCCELLMSSLQPKDLWMESGRWEAYGKELMRLKDRHDREFCLGPTHEEIITDTVRSWINSYKKLPLALYQIQTKYRDEFRPRFGLMRGREFIMKDLYTFHENQKDLDKWYLKVREVYFKIFNRCGLKFRTVAAKSGAIGGNSSEEFMALCEIGEDTIVYNEENTFSSNFELCGLSEGDPSPDGKGTVKHAKGIELGHIFKLGSKYSEPMKLLYNDQDGNKKPVVMGCYGIGVSRLMMAVLEQNVSDKLKVVWPLEVAPFKLHALVLTKATSKQLTKYLNDLEKTYEVLIDDRTESTGVKFNDSDLIGSPYKLIIGKKFDEGIVELIDEIKGTRTEISLKDSLKLKL